MPPNRRLSGFLTEKMAKVTVFSLPEVFCGPQICKKMRWRPGLCPVPAGGAHDALPDPLVG